MARAPYQILAVPFRCDENDLEVLALRRRDGNGWQFVAGGGEDGETPLEAAERECSEELGVSLQGSRITALESVCSVPRVHFNTDWPKNIYVIPEYSFSVDCTGIQLSLGSEHDASAWVDPVVAWAMLRFDSNRTALWEMCERAGKPLRV